MSYQRPLLEFARVLAGTIYLFIKKLIGKGSSCSVTSIFISESNIGKVSNQDAKYGNGVMH